MKMAGDSLNHQTFRIDMDLCHFEIFAKKVAVDRILR